MTSDNRKRRGRPSTGFDKKTYDKERMAQIRAGTWVKRTAYLEGKSK